MQYLGKRKGKKKNCFISYLLFSFTPAYTLGGAGVYFNLKLSWIPAFVGMTPVVFFNSCHAGPDPASLYTATPAFIVIKGTIDSGSSPE